MEFHNYSYKPLPKFKGAGFKRDNSVSMGAELEVVFNCKDDKYAFINSPIHGLINKNERNYYFKSDGSLETSNTTGVEIVFHPRSLKSWYKFKDLSFVLENAVSHNGRSHNSELCGLHIHTDYHYLTNKDRLEVFITAGQICNNQEDFIREISRRKRYDYCKWYNSNKYTLQNMYYNNLNHCDRYNFICSTKGTLEWRFFQGTLKYTSFMAGLEFIDFLSDCIKNKNILEDVFIPDIIQYNNCKGYKYLINYFKERNVLTND